MQAKSTLSTYKKNGEHGKRRATNPALSTPQVSEESKEARSTRSVKASQPGGGLHPARCLPRSHTQPPTQNVHLHAPHAPPGHYRQPGLLCRRPKISRWTTRPAPMGTHISVSVWSVQGRPTHYAAYGSAMDDCDVGHGGFCFLHGQLFAGLEAIRPVARTTAYVSGRGGCYDDRNLPNRRFRSFSPRCPATLMSKGCGTANFLFEVIVVAAKPLTT